MMCTHSALPGRALAVKGRLAEAVDTGEVSGNALLVACLQDKQENCARSVCEDLNL